ncbi:MAG: nuclear transport factor 2 family protein [Rubrivivax sp.]|jgi:ketosteroid isomerase-like protein
MTTLEDLQRRVEQLEHRVEISELVSAYAVACDEHDLPRLRSLFAPDAVLDSPSGLLKADGADEIIAMFVRLFKIRGPGYHWTHDHFLRFDPSDPGRASGTVLSHAETCPDGQNSLAAMRYQDEYVRHQGRWVFAKRVLNFLYYVPVKEYAQCLTDPMRVTVGGRKLPADFPEGLPAWQDFLREHGSAK